jgi:hypothetical protein
LRDGGMLVAKIRGDVDDRERMDQSAEKTLRWSAGASGEDLARAVAGMDRDELGVMLKSMECTFRLDFTEEFLRSASLERLRHIVLSAALHLREDSTRRA